MKKEKAIGRLLVVLLVLSLINTESPAVCAKTMKKTVIQLGQAYDLYEKKKSLEGFDLDELTFKSTDKSVVQVDEDGIVTALAPGEAKIKVKSENKTFVFPFSVKKKGLVYPAACMLVGEKLDMCFNSGERLSDYKWESDNNKIAVVSKKGIVTAKKKGRVTITGSNGEKTFSCKLTVKNKPKSIIYLTFDDGPSKQTTPKILKILKDNDIKATFFEIKPQDSTLYLTKQIVEEGHKLALHGWSHDYRAIYKSEQAYRDNLDNLRDYFFKKTGVWCRLTRFPGGSSNTVSRFNKGIMTKLTKKVPEWGYKYYDWNVSSMDAGGCDTADEVYRYVTGGLKKNRENVVLMHDSVNHKMTIDALERIIQYGKSRGYTFLPMSDSTGEIHHNVNN